VSRTPQTWRWVVISLVLASTCGLFYLLRGVLGPVFFAWLIAYALDPLVDRLEALRMPRGLGIAILITGLVVVFGLFAALALPSIVADFTELARTLYDAVARGMVSFGPWLRERGIPVPSSVESAVSKLGSTLFGLAPSAMGPLGGALQAAAAGTASLLSAVPTLIMVPVFSFYFLYDFDRIVAQARALLPAEVKPTVERLALEMHTVLGDFVLGQITVMAILATLYAVGYAAIGVSLAIPIGVLAGLLSFIPYVGSAVALVFGLIMVMLHFTGMAQVLQVVAVYTVVQLLESFVITPRVLGGKLGLSSLWVLFALLAFGDLFGFVGVMLALPVAAVIKVLVGHLLVLYRSSRTFTGVATQGAGSRPARLKLRRARRDRVRLRAET
jgi:predicted PurR-regulated permease PerM